MTLQRIFGISLYKPTINWNTQDLIIVDKETKEYHLTDVVHPFDTQVKEKEQGEVEPYHSSIWNER